MDWEFGQRYNSEGEWNPRLIACETCGVYLEPEQSDRCTCEESPEYNATASALYSGDY